MAAALTLPGSREIAFVGFMGSGKSTAARAAAAALGVAAVDVDEVIEDRLGKPIVRVFAEDGEAFFRAAEEQITLELLGSGATGALSLGGGGVGHARVRDALADRFVVWLDIDVDEAWERCTAEAARPLAQDRAEFERLYAAREPLYAGVADAVVPAARSTEIGAVLQAAEGMARGVRLLWAQTASGDYPAYIGEGLLGRFWPVTVDGRRFMCSDTNVAPRYGRALEPLLDSHLLAPGEESKTVASASSVWRALAVAGVTREDVVVALGGGVVGDLAGFCAATYQRGIRVVQVPTTVVAQVDSAYGGKTGVDLPEGKNYVGAYHQPAAVIADTAVLRSLPAAELAAGYAEVVKTALIAGGSLWEQVRGGAAPDAPEVVAACARCKLRVVARDERDSGLRQVLNLGHTVGHAIETITGYRRYRHGEAVGLGLLAALRLSSLADLRAEVAELLAARGLPTSMTGVSADEVAAATARDKKRLGERPVPFVLLEAPGRPRTGCEVDRSTLLAAVRELAM